MKGLVYIVIEKATSKVMYVGQTSMSLAKRWNCHLKDPKPYADRVIRARGGRASFECVQVFESSSQTELDDAEKSLIQRYNTLKPHGLNLESGGRTQFVTSEIRNKMRNASPKCRKIKAVVVTTGESEIYDSVRDASRKLKADSSAISKAARGLRKTLSGRTWSYNV